MYGLFTYIWVVYGVNTGKYASPIECLSFSSLEEFSMVIFSLVHPNHFKNETTSVKRNATVKFQIND